MLYILSYIRYSVLKCNRYCKLSIADGNVYWAVVMSLVFCLHACLSKSFENKY